jgi:hypothetical protein
VEKLMEKRKFYFSKIKYLVIDEIDTFIDGGFK